MRHRRALLAASVIAGLSARPADALDPGKALSECSVEVWRAREGVRGWVRAIAQTSEGYLWIGTNTGVARYGGGNVVTLEPDRALARATDVVGLWAAHDGTLWLVPARGEPVCARNGQLADCLPVGQHLDAGVRLAGLQEDRDGAIWLATGEGIYRLAGGRLELVHPAARLPFDHAIALHRDARGTLWVATGTGLFFERGGTFVRHPAATGAVSSLYEGRDGVIWAASERGLLRVAGETSAFFTDGFPAGRPTEVIEDRDGNVWLGGHRGLTRFRAGAGFRTFTHADGLPEDDVTAVFEDREGSLWVGTRGGGVAQFTDRTLDAQMGPPSLQDRWINSVAEDAGGALWVGTRTGLTRWQNGRERTYHVDDGLPSDNVLSVQPAGDSVWIGTDGGLARWRDGRLERPLPFRDPVSALYLDDAGILWIGSTGGLARVAGGHLDWVPAEVGLELNEIRGMQHDDRGTLWLSAGGKLLRVADGRVQPPPRGDPVIGKVRALHRDAEGTLWLGTYDGLARNRGGVWQLLGAGPGGTAADLYQLLSDDRGFLWAGSAQGIVRIAKTPVATNRLAAVAFHLSDQRRDVDAARAHQPGAWRGHDGRLWFATSRGVLSVDPARLRVNAQAPAVRVEQAVVDGRPIRRGRANVFPPGSGALEFHFAALTLVEPHDAQHRYRLDGFDKDWVEAGARRVAYYTNIAPGHYRFRVQASNADGVWNEAGDAVDFTLRPHLYQTWWFYGLCALAGSALVFSFHRLRVAQVHSRYAATFAERNRVARELHDSLLQGMAAALFQLRTVRKRFAPTAPAPATDEVTGDLEKIEGLIGSNMEETRQLVWDLREQAPGAAPIEPALGQLVRRAAETSAIDVRLYAEGAATPLSPRINRELLRIVQEALSNALAHAGARHVEVRVIHDQDSVRLSVRDDGRGFDPARAPGASTGHFGLMGMRERAAAIGAFAVDSQPGRGTTVEVTVRKREGGHG